MRKFRDISTGEIITEEELRKETPGQRRNQQRHSN